VETRHYPNTGIPAQQLGQLRDYIKGVNSAGTLGEPWGAKAGFYKLHYPDGVIIDCKTHADVLSAIARHGETIQHETYFESQTGRKLHLVTTDPKHVTLSVENRKRTQGMRERLEIIMGLIRYIRRVFITHGHDPAWREVQNFVEKECTLKLPTLELAYAASKGRTVIEKLDGESQNCSFAVIVMTGEDEANEELRARENVIHEAGFFQGRYGRERVCLLHEDGVSIPSNLGGVVYCPFPKGRVSAALIDLQRELVAAFAHEG
jgi:predicted nucleotide-binding protein